MSSMTVALIVTAIMAVLFLWGKFPFGLVTMASMIALVATGVLTVQEGFSGMTNNSVILISSIFALSWALQKTSLPYQMQKVIRTLEGKNSMALVAAIVAATLVMETVLGGMVCMVLIVSFLQVLPEDSDVCPVRIILPMLMLTVCWEGAVPIGLGATTDFLANVYMEGIVTNPDQLFHLGNMFTVRIFPTVLTVIYVLFIWKRIPKRTLSAGNMASREIKPSTLKKWQEILVYAAFISVIVVMLFSSVFGSLMWILPAVWVCVLGFTGVLDSKEIISNCANDTVWMLAGILGVTTALTNSGAAEMLGNALVPLISWTDNAFIILVIITAFTAIMTTFLSNLGTIAVLTPLVASMAVAAGMDPRALVACVTVGGTYAFCFPSGSTTCAFAYSLGEYNPFKVMKYTLPLLLILILSTAASASFIFPVF